MRGHADKHGTPLVEEVPLAQQDPDTPETPTPVRPLFSPVSLAKAATDELVGSLTENDVINCMEEEVENMVRADDTLPDSQDPYKMTSQHWRRQSSACKWKHVRI